MTPGRRALAWAALAWAAFTVYGSLVPFHFRALPPGEAVASFRAVLVGGVKIESRSDAAANLLLGVPLGFTLLGSVCADRARSGGRAVAIAFLLLPACALFAAGVEFAQLFTFGRTCAASDIAAQTLGSGFGMAAWVAFGQRLTDGALAVWTRADVDAVGRLLIAYVALVAFIQMLPLDLSARPVDLYRKLRDDVHFRPFGEFDGATGAARWKQIAKLVKLAGLYFPVGLLAARLKGRVGRWSTARVALAALALAVCLEAVQLIVRSRAPGATDAVVGALAAVAGWYAGRVHYEGLALPFAISWGIVWLAGMTCVTQPPPDTSRRDVPRPFDWIPGAPLESGDPLFALEEMLTKVVLFGLLGAIVAARVLPPRTRRGPGGSVPVAVGAAAVLGLVASGFFEAGQRWYDTHTPCITDVLIGGFGAALGVLFASRVRVPDGRRRTDAPSGDAVDRPASG
ncbi:MAG: VanZ family protein [Planctomycetes bacterium]|nr:VanZ family protein [Planctomycetota bacterium]